MANSSIAFGFYFFLSSFFDVSRINNTTKVLLLLFISCRFIGFCFIENPIPFFAKLFHLPPTSPS